MTPENEIAVARNRRPLISAVPFYLPVAVPFTNTADETLTVYTKAAIIVGDVEIIGATTDLESVQGQFSINKRPVWSSADIPLATMFGRPDGPKPVIWFQRPLRLPKGARLRADLVNVGGEGAGTLVFICRQVNGPPESQQNLSNLQDIGEQDVIVIDSQFTGTADEVKAAQTPVAEHDFIARALHTTLGLATVRIIGLGGLALMEDPVPLWAISGKSTSTLPNQPLHQPLFIPAGYTIAIEFHNDGAEAAGALYIVGQRLQ